MPRFCTACGRSLDADGHEVETPKETFSAPHWSRGKRRYGCRVRLVGISPTTGKTITPSSPQREKALGLAAYRHEDNLREDAA
jgi:hypothetical protein